MANVNDISVTFTSFGHLSHTHFMFNVSAGPPFCIYVRTILKALHSLMYEKFSHLKIGVIKKSPKAVITFAVITFANCVYKFYLLRSQNCDMEHKKRKKTKEIYRTTKNY